MLLCTEDVNFSIKNEWYWQVDSVATGRPLEPLLADIFMGHIEGLDHITISKAILYKRYVDNIPVITHNLSDADDILNQVNQVQCNFTLSSKTENHNCLPFLDKLITGKNDGTIERSLYRNPSCTGQYPNYCSFCPI